MESLTLRQCMYIWIIGISVTLSSALPMEERAKLKSHITHIARRLGDRVSEYLEKFQYIGKLSPDPDMQVSEIREGPELTGAIRNFQRMAGITETGELDQNTLEWMDKPRCGFPDVLGPEGRAFNRRQKRYKLLGGQGKWRKNELTYRITNYSPKMSQRDIDDSIRAAFDTWSSVTPLRFRQIFHGYPDIEIQFGEYHHGDGYPFDGPGGTLAHAFGPSPGIGGDAHFDNSERWTVRIPHDGNDFYTVAVHELGHSLGLAHSNAQKAIMRPFYEYSYNVGYEALSQDDVAGIQYLYGYNHNPNPRTPEPTARPRPTPRPTIAQPRTTRATPTRPPIAVPEHCHRDVHFDAIVSTSSGKTYAFEGWQYVYIWEGNVLDPNTPKLVSDVFSELHWGVDAAFTVKEYDREVIYIMKAWFVWTYDAETLQPIRRLVPRGEFFPDLPNSPCGAFRSPYDNYVYVFQGSSYWRLEGEQNGIFNKKVSPGYPRSISDWSLPVRKIGAAMSWQGDIYFFEQNNYYKFNGYDKRIAASYPREVSVWWLGCPDAARQWPMVGEVREGSGSSSVSPANVLWLVATTLSLLLSRT